MRVLGIETSCDETAVSLIEAAGTMGRDLRFEVLGNALASQAALHAQYGGVFPNLAKREHAKNLVPMLEAALKEAGELHPSPQRDFVGPFGELLAREPELLERLSPFLARYAKPQIDAIAVTRGPGLEPALWVGVNFAKALALAWELPVVGVDHMEGHIFISMIENVSRSSGMLAPAEFPVLALLISGGHTELVLMREWGSYKRVGGTRDDAAGEAFDKVARLLGLPYPGGPEISKLAAEARRAGHGRPFALPRPMLHEDNFDFSFSGLKTAVRRIVEAHGQMAPDDKKKLAREFEDATAEVLVEKTLRAVDRFGANTVVVGGGVSANQHIRQELARRLEDEGNVAKLLVPPPSLSTDNALMIALAGYFHAVKNEFADVETLAAQGNLSLAD